MEPRIKLVKVCKLFPTRSQIIEAVKDFDMEIQEGEFVALIGPSGCGKSTIIRMIDGIIAPTSGEIYIDGEKINYTKKMKPEILRRMGFIFQQPNLLPWYTIKENVALPLKIFGLSGKEWDEHVESLLEMVGLQDKANAYPAEISGGMVQRAGVIRAMAHDPEILLMDEPFGALDTPTREQMNMELLEIWKKTKKTVIFITHNVEEAVLLSQRAFVMGTRPGRLIEAVPLEFSQPRTLDLIGTSEFIEYKRKLVDLIGELDISYIK